MLNITNIPAPRVDFIDPRTGLMSREWYRFFLNLFQLTGSGANNTSLTDLQVGPPAVTQEDISKNGGDIEALKLQPSELSALEQIAELQKQVQALALTESITLGTIAPLNYDNIPYLGFATTPPMTPTAVGSLYWDGGTTLGVQMTANVVGRVNEDLYYYIKASSAITKGQVIMFTGSVGASGVVTGAPATGVTDGSYIMGIAAENIAHNGFGLVQYNGTLKGIDTSAFSDGDILWYNPAVTGGLTKTKPVAPNVKVQVAAVINAGSGGSGSILIRVTAGSELGGTDSNVKFTTLANGDLIQYDATAGYWKNVAASSASVTSLSFGTTGLTPSTATTGAITVAGTLVVGHGGTGLTTLTSGGVMYASSTSAFNTSTSLYFDGSNLSVGGTTNPSAYGRLVLGTTSSTSATGESLQFLTNKATFAIVPNGATNAAGVKLSASFANGGQGPIIVENSAGTIATFNADRTLSLAFALAVGSGGTGLTSTPTNGQLLIGNGTGYTLATLSAGSGVSITNGAGSISISATGTGGTVTSVGLSAPTGFAVTGSPVTTTGTLALAFAAGYSLPTTASQSNWDTAYTDRLKWDGGSTGLVAATGRTSLGATTVGSNLFTLTNPSAVTFLRVNADNTVSALDAATFRTAIGAGTSSTTGTVTSVSGSGGTTGLTLTGGPITSSGTLTLGGTLAVGSGGTGLTALTSGYVYYGAGTSAMSVSNIYTDGTNVGINNTNPTGYGGRLVLGNYSVTAAASEKIYIATTRAICELWADGATNANGVFLGVGWANGGQGPFTVKIGASSVLVVDTASVRPGADNSYSSGTAGNRWSVVYAATGTINTSDAETKEQIEELGDVEHRVALRLKSLVKKFKFKDAVNEKGDNARIHIGWIAQEVQQAFESEGLDAGRYAIFCRDEWWEKTVAEVQEHLEIVDGQPVRKAVTTNVLKKYDCETPGAVKKSRLGVRYEQLLAFVVAAL